MKRVLLTGMSGTGKSTVIRALTELGYKAVDVDNDHWSHWVDMRTGLPAPSPAPGEYGWDELDWMWQESRIQGLLSLEDADVLFVAGTAANQGKFHSQFDHIVLLSAPVDVITERLATRTNNPYGRSPRELNRVLEHTRTVEPLLRNAADHEVDTSAPLREVLEIVLNLVDEK